MEKRVKVRVLNIIGKIKQVKTYCINKIICLPHLRENLKKPVVVVYHPSKIMSCHYPVYHR